MTTFLKGNTVNKLITVINPLMTIISHDSLENFNRPCCLATFSGTFRNFLVLNTWLTLSWRRFLPYRNQSIDLQNKSIDWFLYDRDLCHERLKGLVRHAASNLIYVYLGTIKSITRNKSSYSELSSVNYNI